MCGRYVAVSSPTILAERFAVEEVRVTVIAAGFDRWDEGKGRREGAASGSLGLDRDEQLSSAGADLDLGDDEFDVPSFLK